MFIEILSQQPNCGNKPNVYNLVDRINFVCYVYTTKYYLTIKCNDALTYAKNRL
jgi:hypothetical protein